MAEGLGVREQIGLRWLELRARCYADPAQRLRFLQRRIGARPSKTYARCVRAAVAGGIAAALAATVLFRVQATSPAPPRAPAVVFAKTIPRAVAPAAPQRVWLVETSDQSDLYSNGLRVESAFATSTAPRKYLALASGSTDMSGEWRSDPAGIVFHTTESHLAPFEEDQNRALRRDGEGLLEYVSRRRSYHFVIDRFGRVFRIVRESDYANHAGNSVWADGRWIYVNLNQSFFGVAFEAQSHPDGALPVNPAQIHAGRILVEMLRARYAIPPDNCVAHAQVSVNPGNGRAGYHVDWAANLPFADLGLGNNYAEAMPSLALFGFEPDAALVAAGASLQAGIESAEELVRAEAVAWKMPIERYRRVLQQRYRDAEAAQRSGRSE